MLNSNTPCYCPNIGDASDTFLLYLIFSKDSIAGFMILPRIKIWVSIVRENCWVWGVSSAVFIINVELCKNFNKKSTKLPCIKIWVGVMGKILRIRTFSIIHSKEKSINI